MGAPNCEIVLLGFELVCYLSCHCSSIGWIEHMNVSCLQSLPFISPIYILAKNVERLVSALIERDR